MRTWNLIGLSVLGIFIFSSLARANVIGTDTQIFNPITNGLDFITVHSSKTLEPRIINLGFFFNFAANSLPNYENTKNQSRTNIVDALFSSDLNAGVGLGSNWDLGASLSQVHSQSVGDGVSRAYLENIGITEFRLNTKLRVWESFTEGGIALVGSANLNQIEGNPFTGSNPDPTFNLELVWDFKVGETNVSTNLGYRWRNPGDPIPGAPIYPFGDQYLGSIGVSYPIIPWDTKVIGEIYGSYPAQSNKTVTDRNLSSAELLVGFKTEFPYNFSLHVGGGTELIHGMGGADWRVYTGLNWAIGPLFAQKEDVLVRLERETGGPSAGISTQQERFLFKNVLFASGSTTVKKRFEVFLVEMVDYLKKLPDGFDHLLIEGYSDSVGPAEGNRKLSLRRAQSVYRVMIDAGLDPQKVKVVGRGEENPIASNSNYQGRAHNRRVELRIYLK